MVEPNGIQTNWYMEFETIEKKNNISQPHRIKRLNSNLIKTIFGMQYGRNKKVLRVEKAFLTLNLTYIFICK